MGEVRIRHGHALGAEEAAARLKALAGELGRRYGLEVSFDGGGASFSGRGFSGRAEATARAVTVRVALPFLVPEHLVEEGIREFLGKHFGADQGGPTAKTRRKKGSGNPD
jgi:hypothetical protein